MTGKIQKPIAPRPADPLPPPQQMAGDGSENEPESFANIEPDGAVNFANINPTKD